MNAWIKGALWGFGAGIILLILSYILPSIICPDFFRIGPAYPTDQPFCSLLISNPLRAYAPFPALLLIWLPWLIVTAIIGSIIGKIKSK